VISTPLRGSRPRPIVMTIATLVRNGGGERYCVELAKGLIDAGFDVKVLTTRLDRDSCYPEITSSLEIETPRLPHWKTRFKRVNDLRDAIGLGLRSARVGEQAVVIAHGWPAHWAAMILGRRSRCKIIWACNDYMFSDAAAPRATGVLARVWRRTLFAIDRFVARRFDGIMVLSDYARHQVEVGYGVPAQVVRPTFPYMFSAPATARADPEDPSRILGLNILMPHRGVEDVLAAVALLEAGGNHVRYTHVGGADSVSYRDRLDGIVDQTGIRAMVDFVGVVDEDRRLALLDHSDVFVFTPSAQTYSLAVLEAVGRGLPTIVASGSGIAEVISASGAGLVYQAGDPADLADKICTVLEDRQVRQQLQTGRGKLMATYGWKQALKQWEATIRGREVARPAGPLDGS
jgi:glycosyltransferase involved in cell wall biosynthesis